MLSSPRPVGLGSLFRPQSPTVEQTSVEHAAPSGFRAKAAANLDAIRTLRDLEASGRIATDEQRSVLARWSAWGALPKVFDDDDTEWAIERAELRSLLTDREWDAARRTTINAHYTPPTIVAAMWDAVRLLGLDGGFVLEPGAGSGNFLAAAPAGCNLTGVELDPVTAAICKHTHPAANVRCEGFEQTPFPDDWFDLAIGNVPFGKITLHDPAHNRGRHSMHNHFLIKSLHLVRPCGLVAMISSRFTMDSHDDSHRAEIAEIADLVGAVRLPGGAMRATAGTDVVADVLLFRKRAKGKPSQVKWMDLASVDTADGPVEVNEYFAANPAMVLGTFGCRNGQYNERDTTVKAFDGPVESHLRAALSTIVGAPLPDVDPELTPVEIMDDGPQITVCEPCPIDSDEPAEFSAEADRREVEEFTATFAAPTSVEEPADPIAELTAQLFEALSEVDDGDDAPVEMDTSTTPPRARRKRGPRRPSIDARPALPSDSYDPQLHQEGTILRTSDRGFMQVLFGMLSPFDASSKKDEAELAVLCDLRDTVVGLVAAQAATDDDSRFAHLQAELNERYDSYVARFGPLNRYTLAKSGRFDENGEEKLRKIRPRMGGFGDDPAFYTVMALEHFDPDDQVATKADIFTKRVVGPRTSRDHAETAAEALSICLDEIGRVDLDRVAQLLGVTADEARAQLGTLVWDNPTFTGPAGVVTAAEYLSGNVRSKLEVAQRAARTDARWQHNVDALAAVMPDDLGPGEIDARLGAPWLDVDDVQQFLVDTLVDPRRRTWWGYSPEVEYSKVNATWEISMSRSNRTGLLMTSTWGTPRADAIQLALWSLNQTTAAVYDTFETADGKKKVLNVDETFKAKEKQDQLQDRFRAWVWESPERTARYVERYNRLFNSTVLPKYDGSHLTLPGLSMAVTPHPHQLDAIWRVLQSPTALLAHPVGAGKSLCGAAAAIEMKRMGIVNKPAFVVPNHMLDQFATEIMRLYPLAKVLVPTKKDMTPGGRKNFVARCAMGDWDAVMLTHSAFEKIPVTGETAAAFLQDKIDAFREAKEAASQRMTVKKLEAAALRMEQKIISLQNAEAKDDGVCFESTGIDYVFCDESQAFKNLGVESHLRSVTSDGSQRAADLELKLDYLRSKMGDRVATFMTATPIANTIAEMFVVQKYLQPRRLAEAGIDNFDGWAATFGSTVTALELAPDGGSYRMHTRFARFHNVPELVTMFREVADVLTPEDLNLPIPTIVGDKPETVIVSPSDTLRGYVQALVARAKAVRLKLVHPTEDNMLKVCTDGRKAALDLRLVQLLPDPAGGKIAACAAKVANLYHRDADREFFDPDGALSRRKGSFQLVFCDLGTPRLGWNAYDQLKEELVLRGVPDTMIRFVHHATDARAKAELFAACRAGRVGVLVGSTDKMGIGTNVQTRLTALHHLDCPWRPDMLEQRDGRGLRQGNQNDEVSVLRYATEGSFDVYMWQTVERKSRFIHQVMRGQTTTREVDDISEQALSYAEIKALATGNPLIMEKAGVDNDVARLLRLKQAHAADQRHIGRRLTEAIAKSEAAEHSIAVYEQALAQRDTPEDFEIVIDGVTYTKRAEAGTLLRDKLLDTLHLGIAGEDVEIARYAGFVINARAYKGYSLDREVIMTIEGTPLMRRYDRPDTNKLDEIGVCQQIENDVRSLDRRLAEAHEDLAAGHADEQAARDRHGLPFDQEPLLESMLAKQAELEAKLGELEEKEHAA